MHASLPIAIVQAIKDRNSIKILRHSKKNRSKEKKNHTQKINLNRVYQALMPIEKVMTSNLPCVCAQCVTKLLV